MIYCILVAILAQVKKIKALQGEQLLFQALSPFAFDAQINSLHKLDYDCTKLPRRLQVIVQDDLVTPLQADDQIVDHHLFKNTIAIVTMKKYIHFARVTENQLQFMGVVRLPIVYQSLAQLNILQLQSDQSHMKFKLSAKNFSADVSLVKTQRLWKLKQKIQTFNNVNVIDSKFSYFNRAVFVIYDNFTVVQYDQDFKFMRILCLIPELTFLDSQILDKENSLIIYLMTSTDIIKMEVTLNSQKDAVKVLRLIDISSQLYRLKAFSVDRNVLVAICSFSKLRDFAMQYWIGTKAQLKRIISEDRYIEDVKVVEFSYILVYDNHIKFFLAGQKSVYSSLQFNEREDLSLKAKDIFDAEILKIMPYYKEGYVQFELYIVQRYSVAFKRVRMQSMQILCQFMKNQNMDIVFYSPFCIIGEIARQEPPQPCHKQVNLQVQFVTAVQSGVVELLRVLVGVSSVLLVLLVVLKFYFTSKKLNQQKQMLDEAYPGDMSIQQKEELSSSNIKEG